MHEAFTGMDIIEIHGQIKHTINSTSSIQFKPVCFNCGTRVFDAVTIFE